MAAELFCCTQCGRDTTSRAKICHRCYGYRGGYSEGRRGRKERDRAPVENNPFEPVREEQPEEQTVTDLYHGETLRDDL